MEEALDRIKWRNNFGRGCGPVVGQITDDGDDELFSADIYRFCFQIYFYILVSSVWGFLHNTLFTSFW
jgi:hypothetical protein